MVQEKFRIFVSSVQDEFAEERRRLKAWLSADLFLSRFVESVFLFEDAPSRGNPPSDVFLDEVNNSDIYIGLIGSQYYGRASAKRGVSATEQEYDAAEQAGCERWIYLKAVDSREKEADAFVDRVNRDVTRTTFDSFDDLRSAVYSSFVAFLDRHELIEVGDFDKSVCREMTAADVSDECVKWYLAEMALRKRKAALPLSTTADELLTRLGLMKGSHYTWAAALCFSKNPQQWSYRTTLKCAWNEGIEYGRPFLDTDKFEGNLFELMRQGVDFVTSHIAQSRGLRTESFQAPMRFELPREAVEEALVNALVHRDWRLSASVEVRLFADRVEIWNPGALPEGITISKLYETHSSYPVNELVLKVFDFAGIIESLGTGIGRMIDACRKNGLPDPTWEQRGSSFVVTIWKDMWTEARLSELGLSERQKSAVRAIKTSRQMAASDYMVLTDVARNTATRDLQKLVSLKVFVPSGKGKHTIYSINRLCTIYAPYAPSSVKASENRNLPMSNCRNHGISTSANAGLTGRNLINEGLNEGINEGLKFDVFRLILENPGCRVPFFIKKLSVSRATVERAIAALIAVGKIEHRGSKKTGGYYVVK